MYLHWLVGAYACVTPVQVVKVTEPIPARSCALRTLLLTAVYIASRTLAPTTGSTPLPNAVLTLLVAPAVVEFIPVPSNYIPAHV